MLLLLEKHSLEKQPPVAAMCEEEEEEESRSAEPPPGPPRSSPARCQRAAPRCMPGGSSHLPRGRPERNTAGSAGLLGARVPPSGQHGPAQGPQPTEWKRCSHGRAASIAGAGRGGE